MELLWLIQSLQRRIYAGFVNWLLEKSVLILYWLHVEHFTLKFVVALVLFRKFISFAFEITVFFVGYLASSLVSSVVSFDLLRLTTVMSS